MQIIYDGIKLNLHEREASLVLELLDGYIRAGGSYRGMTDLGPDDIKRKKAKDNMANAMHDILYDYLYERHQTQQIEGGTR